VNADAPRRQGTDTPDRSNRLRARLAALLSIGDQPGDSDDTRLRKRMGVAAGYITILAPLSLPFEPVPAPPAILWTLGLGLAAYSAINLIVLWRTRKFDRYVVALSASGPVFVFATNATAGGVTTSGAASVWTFLTPAYAILALGPKRATPWLVVFLVALLINVVFDPIIRTWFQAPAYPVQLVLYAQNVGVPLAIVFLLLRYTDTRRRAAEARSDELLTNAIPRSIADRLRHGESRIADAYPATTVVFCDIVGSTPWVSSTEPDRVVALLDDLFTRLDAVAATHRVEKIKTVGDAYMAVAGAPEARPDHAPAAVRFGLAVLREVSAWRAANGVDLEVRVGAASGPAVGGVIGRQRMLFDVWGGTVTMASRMESTSVPGRLQIAPTTRDLLAGTYALEERHLEVKGLGRMTAYLVNDAHELSAAPGAT
jgi:adenylate cyclase